MNRMVFLLVITISSLQKGSVKKVRQSKDQMKYLYTNAHSTNTKQEELVATAQLENYDMIAVTET